MCFILDGIRWGKATQFEKLSQNFPKKTLTRLWPLWNTKCSWHVFFGGKFDIKTHTLRVFRLLLNATENFVIFIFWLDLFFHLYHHFLYIILIECNVDVSKLCHAVSCSWISFSLPISHSKGETVRFINRSTLLRARCRITNAFGARKKTTVKTKV